ncbi:MAG: transporter substrate-binding domain-containing protein [Desulfuromusa sp.]|nr:transporter substrate-binding domain-containing protein [Desulfuromusa sp.]
MKKLVFAGMLILFMLLTALSVGAKELDAIKAEGEPSFALTGQYPPFNFVDENNQVTGFDVEIGQELAKRIGEKADSYPGTLSGEQKQRIADRVVFMADDYIVKEGAPAKMFRNPQKERTQEFLADVAHG